MNNIIQLAEKRQLAQSLKSSSFDPLYGEGRDEIVNVATEAALTAIANLQLLGQLDNLNMIHFAAFRAANTVRQASKEALTPD